LAESAVSLDKALAKRGAAVSPRKGAAAMKMTGRAFTAVFVLALLRGNPAAAQADEPPKYSSFRDIPGVTREETAAVKALRKNKNRFVYGMNEGIEAFYGQNGEIKGYAALFCEYLGQLFGIPFKPALYEWGDLVAGLEDGGIDFTGEMTVTEERRKTYFMTDAIAERSIKYYSMKKSLPVEYIQESRPLRYAFLDGAVTQGYVAPFIDKNTEIFFVSDYKEARGMLENGAADAFFEENTAWAFFETYGDMSAKDFDPLIYNPVSMSTRNPELAPVIAVVQKMLKSEGARYLVEMYQRGQREYTASAFFNTLSVEERAYVRARPVVRFAAEYDNYPVSFYNAHEQEWQGVFFDVLKELEALTGISFEIVNGTRTEWAELLKMLEDGRASMVSELIKSEDRQGRFLWPQTPLLWDRHALISKKSYHNVSINEILYTKVGVVKSTIHADLFNIWFPDHPNTVEYESSDYAFKALEKGEVDLVMTDKNMILVLTNYMELPGYKVNVLFDRPYGSFVGFNRNEEVLRSVIDKALNYIDIAKISENWLLQTYDYRVKVAQARLPWLVGASVLLLSVIALLFVLYQKTLGAEKRLEDLVWERTAELNRQYEIVERLSNTDMLTGIPNRRNFDSLLNTEWRRAMRDKLPLSCLMLDVDRFKKYNDTYGHQEGDRVLRDVAACVKRTLKRPGDFAARWGGEEFAVLLPNTDSAGAANTAESIRANVEAETDVTVSAGVSTRSPEQNSSLDRFLSAADNALYEAKRQGRNRVCVSGG